MGEFGGAFAPGRSVALRLSRYRDAASAEKATIAIALNSRGQVGLVDAVVRLTLPRLKPVGFLSHSRRLDGSHSARVLGGINTAPVSRLNMP